MKRTAGIVAMVLGLVGIVLSVLGGLWAFRLVTGAGDFASDAVSGVESSLQRAEDRISYASLAVDGAEVEQRLAAARDGFAAAAEAADGLDGHPLISLLPVDVEGLEIAAGRVLIGDARDDTEEALGDAASGLVQTREQLDDFSKSLRFWTRLGGFLLLVMALWSIWAQYHLAGWGWQAWRANPPEV